MGRPAGPLLGGNDCPEAIVTKVYGLARVLDERLPPDAPVLTFHDRRGASTAPNGPEPKLRRPYHDHVQRGVFALCRRWAAAMPSAMPMSRRSNCSALSINRSPAMNLI